MVLFIKLFYIFSINGFIWGCLWERVGKEFQIRLGGIRIVLEVKKIIRKLLFNGNKRVFYKILFQ